MSDAADPRTLDAVRILATADIHYSLRQFDWLAGELEGVDLLVLAGDLLDSSSAVEMEVQELVVGKYLRRFAGRRTVLSSSGNHDIQNLRSGGERTAQWMEDLARPELVPDYTSYQRDGVVFSVFPWWDGPETLERAVRRLEADAALPKQTWIWLHHNPPAGTPVAWTGRKCGGDAVATGWIERYQPDFVFSGHIHNAPFYGDGSWHARLGRSTIFNAGKQPGPEPARIILDLANRSAEWQSFEGSERVDW